MELIVIGSVFMVFFVILSLSIKYLFKPLFFKPKLDLNETIKFLESEGLYYVDKREINKKEKKLSVLGNNKGFSVKNICSERIEYIVVGYSKSKKEYRFFWLELIQLHPFVFKFLYDLISGHKIQKRRSFKFIEIHEAEILIELNNTYTINTVPIIDKCPACLNAITDKMNECLNCGLNLVA